MWTKAELGLLRACYTSSPAMMGIFSQSYFILVSMLASLRCKHFQLQTRHAVMMRLRNVRNRQAHSVLLWGWIPKEGDSSFGAGSSNRGAEHPCWRGIPKGAALPWPEESKETGGFVAGTPMGTASPWHTTLLAKYSVLYLCEGEDAGGGFLSYGDVGQKTVGCAVDAQHPQHQAKPDPSPEQRDIRS